MTELPDTTEAEVLLRILERGNRQVEEGKFVPAEQAFKQLRQRPKHPPKN